MQGQFELRRWQKSASEFFWSNGGKCVFECATGSGKTYVATTIIYHFLQENPCSRVLIVVPKNVLIERGWFDELFNFGVPLQDIGVYYGGIKELSRVTITNMQIIGQVPLHWFDFIVYDEVHNYMTRRLEPLMDAPAKYKLGLSATLDKEVQQTWQLLSHFNYNVFKYTPSEAIRDEVLNAFDFVEVVIQLDEDTQEKYKSLSAKISYLSKLHRVTNDDGECPLYKALNERKRLIYNYYQKFDAVREIVRRHITDKIIVFNEYNESTNKLYWHLLESGVKSAVVHSNVDRQQFQDTLTAYRNDEFSVLLSTRALDEGYNLPKIDTAIIMAGCGVDRQTIQRMGRVLRKKEKNSFVYQIYCSGTMEEVAAIKRRKIFKPICESYSVLRFIDGELSAAACGDETWSAPCSSSYYNIIESGGASSQSDMGNSEF